MPLADKGLGWDPEPKHVMTSWVVTIVSWLMGIGELLVKFNMFHLKMNGFQVPNLRFSPGAELISGKPLVKLQWSTCLTLGIQSPSQNDDWGV